MSPEAARQLMEVRAFRGASVNDGARSQAHPGHLALVVAILTLLIWSTLAVSVVSLSTVPPLLTTGIALTGGGLLGLPWVKGRALDWRAVLVGSLSMFGYHALYFLSLQWADPVAASLLHYLWPLFIVLLTPVMLKEHRISILHVLSAVCGFAGAAACIASGPVFSNSTWAGFALAAISGLIWAYYTVWSRKRSSVPTSTVALYCVLAGGLALTLYAGLQSNSASGGMTSLFGVTDLSARQWATLAFLAIGPLGGTFYMWDFAIKRGRPNQIAMLAYAVPIVSTLFRQSVAGTDWALVLALDAADANAGLRSLVSTSLIVLVLTGGLAALILTVLVTKIFRRLSVVRDAMDAIGSGDGDLTQRLPAEGKDEVAQIARSFNAFADKLMAVLVRVKGGSDEVSVAATEIAAGNDDLSKRTEAQAASLEETASSMEQLTNMVRQTSDNAQEARGLATKASPVAGHGGEVMGQVVETMGAIHDSARRIAEITAVIEGIAFQTNILALNAAVSNLTSIMGEISLASEQQSAGIQQVNAAIGQMDHVTQQNAALVEQASAAATSLREQTQNLNEAVSTFLLQAALAV